MHENAQKFEWKVAEKFPVIALSKIACGKYTFFEINFSIGSKLSRSSITAAKDQ